MAGKLGTVRRLRAVALCGWSRGAMLKTMPAKRFAPTTGDIETIKAVAHLSGVAG